MKKLFNKSMAMLISVSMLLASFGTMSVFAENANYAKADFDNANSAQGAYEGMTFSHSSSKPDGNPVIVEDKTPYYGKMLKYEQSGSSDKDQIMLFTLDNALPLGENVAENTYAEFSCDFKLEKASTGLIFDYGSGSYRLNFNDKGSIIPRVVSDLGAIGKAPSGTSKVFNNFRFKIDLHNKKIVAVYADDELVANTDFACAADSTTSIEKFRIYIAKSKNVDTLYLDNVNVVTYVSADGTSPLANKTVLRAKLMEFVDVGLVGSGKVTFDNAVALAKNPVATQADVDAMVLALENINKSGLPEVIASADFDNANTAAGTYSGVTFSHSSSKPDGSPVIIEDETPYYGKMVKYEQSGSSDKDQIMLFTLDNALPLGENVAENTYAEFSCDFKLEKASTGLIFDYGSGSYRLNFNDKGSIIPRVVSDLGAVGKAPSGTSKVFNNFRFIIDLHNKKIVAVYADDELVANTDFACAADSTTSIEKFRIYIAKSKNVDTLYLDNVNVVTYVSADGTSPIGLKKALRDKIGEIYTYAFNSQDAVKFNNALAVAKNPVATAEDVANALASLNTIKLTNTKVLASEDFEAGVDGDYADFTYTTTYSNNAAKTETILTAQDANPIFNKMFALMQGDQTGDTSAVKNMYPIANFDFKNPVVFDGAKEGDFAEVAFDVKVRAKGSTTFAFLLRDEANREIARINVGNDIVRVGYGYTNEDTRVGLYKTIGLEDSFDKNIKMVFDLYNKDIETVFVDGVRLLDRTEEHNPVTNVALNPATGSQISKITFNWSDGADTSTTTNYTFAVDNLRVMTYSGETPEANKSALLRAINTRYATSDSAVLVKAKNVYKDLFATQEDVDAAVESLAGLNTYLSEIVAPQKNIYTDSLIKPDFSADGITFTCTSVPTGYIDGDLKVTQPVGESVDVAITYTLSRGEKSVSKTYNVTVHPRVFVEINEAIFEDAEGNTVYGPTDGGKLKSVTLKNNSGKSDITFYAAVYEGGRLQSVKPAPVTNGTKTLDMAVNKNSEIKYFVWENDILVPIQATREVIPDKPTLHIVADSIYADYSLDVYKGSQPDYGIGQALSVLLVGTDIKVNNKAHPGSKVPFWYESGRLDSILSEMKQGDYLLISLCHNDQKYATISEFKTHLTRVANEAKEQGVIPFFVTAIPRYTWNSNGELNYSHTRDGENYVQAVIDTANAMNAPLIDMNAHLREVYTAEGTTSETYEYWYSLKDGEELDRTHLSEEGAMYCANWLIGELKEMNFPFVQGLADE